MKNTSTVLLLSFLTIVLGIPGCSSSTPIASPAAEAESEAEPIARTEFTDRIENFFEYEPLHAGKPSQFRIHLTDLADGSPVENADVSLLVRPKGGTGAGSETKAKVGKVTGIYVAELTIPSPGEYDIEFHVKNPKLDERLPLSDFKVD